MVSVHKSHLLDLTAGWPAVMDFVLASQGDSSTMRDAQLWAIQSQIARLCGLAAGQIHLFASERDIVLHAVHMRCVQQPNATWVLCGPVRQALSRALLLCGPQVYEVPRDHHGLSQLVDWQEAYKRFPNGVFVVSWEPEAPLDLQHALQAGVPPRQLVVFASAGFVGQRPWALPVRPGLTITAVRDPDAPDPPLASVLLHGPDEPAPPSAGAELELSQPTMSALSGMLLTLVNWPAWCEHAVALLGLRAAVLAEQVAGAPALQLWPRHGAEVLVRCPDNDAEAWVQRWQPAGWRCRVVTHPAYGAFVAVDLFASHPRLPSSEEWPA